MLRVRRYGTLVLTLSMGIGAVPAAAQQPSAVDDEAAAPSAATREAAATITVDEMRDHITFLAGDRLRGRDTPSPGLDTAANHLVREFAGLGLEPAAGDGDYVQRYPFPTVALDAQRARLALRHGGGTATFEYGRDFFALPGADDADGEEIVFVGAGIESADADAVDGRVALVALEDPAARAWRTTVGPVREAARSAGAAAVIFVLDDATDAARVGALARLTGEPQTVLGGVETVPAFFVRRDAVREPLREAGIGLEGEAPAGGVPASGLETVAARAPVRVLDDATAPNVVAVLPGSDPALRDSYVVFSAHMDHVGVGSADASGDSIYNGADDNASGTAALIEIAEAFAELPEAPARSVVFLAVSGEEKGLLGSRWFTDHPTLPLERVVANINVDMIARNSPDSVVVIGQEYSSLGPLVRDVAQRHPELGLTVSEDLWPEQRFFFRSDHFNFARAEIPALFFFAGTHEDYHQPSDEADTIDADKAARVARLIFHTAHAIASAEEPPRWTESGLEEIRAVTQ